ncbi:TrkH family potassium uptake protein [Segatella bryantii]|jgi:trk system potassium uptake protein TrkH|uniref:Potassium transporter n=1 Tax=Segatella bryantii TaxID=77095 RepID=A0ABX4ELQ6_SEGBR|nr:TrkH family potassium uptake protein [Segatella bryantii]MDR4931833.1 TrkH family potassium uptake protein [Segatella bryantii]OYP57259.1 potassium transporter [Segatella bryantii]UKK75837.1 TrkH family potassium uptake protein [Segatella bryantii]UKK80499.1 TrkH family potassium uptake protein [Segatella bryantii]
MINWKIIYKVIGQLLFLEATLMFYCTILSFCYREDDSLAFVVSTITTVLAGFILKILGRKEASNNLSRREAYLVVALTWVVFSLFGTLPFMISGYIANFTDAYFETMSGFTTTGATIIDSVEILPHGLLFWRSLSQWIGGLGIVFFTIALLPSLVGGNVRIFAAEATGPIKSKLHPRLSTSAKWIWLVYIILTIGCTLGYYIGGMNVFDSINYAMTTTATGGFATHDTSIEFFNSKTIEYVCIIFTFLSGTNFTLLYFSLSKLRFKELWKNSEFRLYLFSILFFSTFIAVELIIRNHYHLEYAIRCGLFQVVSFMTTTGLFNDNAGTWPHVTWIALAVCMFLGGSSGSTAGGFKSIRGVMILKIIRNEFKQKLHPNAVLPLKVDGTNVPNQKRVTLLAYLATYIILFMISSFVMTAAGIDYVNSTTITLSAIGNVGPSLGMPIGPTMSWSSLPDFAKWICSLMMLVGRLEIFTVLVIFTPQFWRGR